jgi:hypothetical protein
MLSINRPEYDAVTYWGMMFIAILVTGLWVLLLKRQKKRYGVIAFMAVSVVIVLNLLGDQLGWFTRLDILPPPFVVMNLAILTLIFILGMGYGGQFGNKIVSDVPVQTLVALQVFRLPLELLMLRAAKLEIMPIEFSMLGYNFDVLTGLGALLLILYAARKKSIPKAWVWSWNVMGIGFLLVIAVLAVMTSPNLHAFGGEPAHINSWILYFPYSLLPSLLVSFAVFGHLLLTRKLLQEV